MRLANSRPSRFDRAQSQDDNSEDEECETGVRFRPVTIVNAGARKVLELKVEVPVEDMAQAGRD